MSTTEALVKDFFDIIEHKDAHIGRDLVIRDAGLSYRGPISDIRRTSADRLIITMEWRAAGYLSDGTEKWRLTDDTPYSYSVELVNMTTRYDEDGTLHITVRRSWVGDILPASAPRLQKPVD